MSGCLGEQQVEALLQGEARNDAEQRRRRGDGETEALLQRRLVADAHVDAQGAVVDGELGIGGGVPHRVVDAVDDAFDDGRARPQQAVERHAELGRHDFARVGRRDGGDAVGELQAAFEVADAVEVLDPVDRHRARGQADRG